MTIRQNISPIEDKDQLSTGYDIQNNDPSTFYIPPCGLEDVDTAVHSLFDKEIKFRTYQGTSGTQKEINLKKPFVIFATGERFALAKRLKPFRDRSGQLLLPAISIRRTGIEQQHNDVFFGELTIKRRLDPSDVDYQNLINRYFLKNVSPLPATLRTNAGVDADIPSIKEGMLLDTNSVEFKNNHVYEIITAPFPQFFTATYEIVFWTTYTNHMNYMIETFLTSQITPGKGFCLKTEKGYWFNATVENSLTPQDNFEDMTDSERLIKYSFSVVVRGFLLATQGAGQRVPFKRYLSSVNISFETTTSEGEVAEKRNTDDYNDSKNDHTKDNSFILTDSEEGPATKQKTTSQEKFAFRKEYYDSSGKKRVKYVKEMSNNQKKGETTYSASDQETLMQFFVDQNKGF